jgi:hypothetical protein
MHNDGEPASVLVKLRVNLTGSNLGPGYYSADYELTVPASQPALDIRTLAAEYHAVPLDQVGEPRPCRRS